MRNAGLYLPGLDVGPYAEVLGGLHHCVISVEPAHWNEIVRRLDDTGVEHVIHSDVSVSCAEEAIGQYPRRAGGHPAVGSAARDHQARRRGTGPARRAERTPSLSVTRDMPPPFSTARRRAAAESGAYPAVPND